MKAVFNQIVSLLRQIIWPWFQTTKFGQWFTKPRSTLISVLQLVAAFFLLLVYVPYVGLLVHLFALALGAMGILNLTREKTPSVKRGGIPRYLSTFFPYLVFFNKLIPLMPFLLPIFTTHFRPLKPLTQFLILKAQGARCEHKAVSLFIPPTFSNPLPLIKSCV